MKQIKLINPSQKNNQKIFKYKMINNKNIFKMILILKLLNILKIEKLNKDKDLNDKILYKIKK